MYILELILLTLLSPFWVPVLLVFIGVCILICGGGLLILLGLSLGIVVWILQTLYNIHIGFVNARKTVLVHIEKELNSKISWWRFMNLIYKAYLDQLRENKNFRASYAKEKNNNGEIR